MNSYEFSDSFGTVLLEGSDDMIWVTAQSVYETLGYKNGTKEVRRHVSPENIRVLKVPEDMRGRNGRPTRLFINQDGVAELVLKAQKMPRAEVFREWFFKKVVPQGMKALRLKALTQQRQIVSLDESYGKALRMLWEGQEKLIRQNQLMHNDLEKMKSFVESACSAAKIDGMNWREAARYIVAVNSKKNGADYSASYHEIYSELEKAMGVKLAVRQKNLQKKTGKKNITLLDVVAADKKLIPTFISILRMYALSHGIHVEIKAENQESTTKGVA